MSAVARQKQYPTFHPAPEQFEETANRFRQAAMTAHGGIVDFGDHDCARAAIACKIVASMTQEQIVAAMDAIGE